MISFDASILLGIHDGQRTGNRLSRFALLFFLPSLFPLLSSSITIISCIHALHYRAFVFFSF
jgi:hypothetical protein